MLKYFELHDEGPLVIDDPNVENWSEKLEQTAAEGDNQDNVL